MNYRPAIDDATHAIELDPASEHAHATRGRAKLELGEPRQALDDLKIALEFAPDSSFDLLRRGQAHFALEDWESAIRDFTALLGQEPKALQAYEGRASAYEHIGQPELAETDRNQKERLDDSAGPQKEGDGSDTQDVDNPNNERSHPGAASFLAGFLAIIPA